MLVTSRNTNKGGAVQAPTARRTSAPAVNRAAVAREVEPHQVVTDAQITRHGSVATIGASNGSFVTITLTPGTSAAKEYIIGDAYGLIAAAIGKSYSEPDSVSGNTPAGFKNATQQGIAISGIHYQVSTSASQFAQPLKMVSGNYDGSFAARPLNVLGTSRPDYQNDKLLVFEFTNNIVLDSRNALSLTVAAGEEVTLNIFIASFGF